MKYIRYTFIINENTKTHFYVAKKYLSHIKNDTTHLMRMSDMVIDENKYGFQIIKDRYNDILELYDNKFEISENITEFKL